MFSIDPETGETGWTLEVEDGVGRRVIAGDDGNVYTIVDDREILAIDGSDGSELWRSDRASDDLAGSLALDSRGVLYARTDTISDSNLYAFDTNDEGAELWRLEVEDELGDPVVGFGDQVYVAAGRSTFSETEYQLYALDGAGDGESAEWTFDGGGQISTEPAIGSDGTVYIRQDDTMYALAPDSGEEDWSAPLEQNAARAPRWQSGHRSPRLCLRNVAPKSHRPTPDAEALGDRVQCPPVVLAVALLGKHDLGR